ncbi:12076_t:CDS:2, partial [Funneliformis geosporum]
RNERIPDPGEQFSYIIVKGPRLRDEKGRLIPYRVGIIWSITVAMCARFINENDNYQPHLSYKIMQIKDPDVREKKIDKYFQDEA